jgi:hypothetical protein
MYAQKFGGPERRFPSETGKAFWLKLTQTKPPLIDADQLEVLICPYIESTEGPPSTTYSGPSKDVNVLKDEDVIGCCRHPDHPDGTMFIRKDGEILMLKGAKAERLLEQVKD